MWSQVEKKEKKKPMKALLLAKKFVRDYFGYQRITSDMLNVRRDGLIEILSSYGNRVYVDEKKNQAFWGFMGTGPNHPNLLGTIPCIKAKQLGYNFKVTRLFGVNYLEIIGVKK